MSFHQLFEDPDYDEEGQLDAEDQQLIQQYEAELFARELENFDPFEDIA